MGYHEMEIGLKQVAAYVARWHETGRVPTIERDIVLERMQRIYAEIMQLRCTDGVAMQLAAARVEVEHVPATNGYDGMAPEDESFEVNGGGVDYGFAPMAESVAATEPAATAQFEERPTAEREDRMSQTTHTVQEVGEQDPCPSQTRFLEEREVVLPFPEAAAADSAVEPEPVEPVTITETEIEPEPESEPEQEIEVPAKGGRSEESYLTQESGSREGCPQATEVPAMEPEITAPTNTSATERAAEADETPRIRPEPGEALQSPLPVPFEPATVVQCDDDPDVGEVPIALEQEDALE